ncbi:MAG: 30S ribosomal protein S5, partial [Thermoplasmata archaeon]|nr:30S ribosomal protein S5 [Thermoplasmata archaeon]
SVEVTLKPAPRGVGLAVGDVAKHILRLAGFEDVWGFTRGQTRTTVNYAKSVFNALEQVRAIRVRQGQTTAFGIKEGSVEV